MAAIEEVASDGTRLLVDSYPWEATYSGGYIQTETLTTPSGATYTRTYTWSGSVLQEKSQWVKDVPPEP